MLLELEPLNERSGERPRGRAFLRPPVARPHSCEELLFVEVFLETVETVLEQHDGRFAGRLIRRPYPLDNPVGLSKRGAGEGDGDSLAGLALLRSQTDERR